MVNFTYIMSAFDEPQSFRMPGCGQLAHVLLRVSGKLIPESKITPMYNDQEVQL